MEQSQQQQHTKYQNEGENMTQEQLKEIKRQQKKEQNNKAARRFRAKKHVSVDDLIESHKKIYDRMIYITDQNNQKQDKIVGLENLLNQIFQNAENLVRSTKDQNKLQEFSQLQKKYQDYHTQNHNNQQTLNNSGHLRPENVVVPFPYNGNKSRNKDMQNASKTNPQDLTQKNNENLPNIQGNDAQYQQNMQNTQSVYQQNFQGVQDNNQNFASNETEKSQSNSDQPIITQDPNNPVSQIPLLGEQEVQELREFYNNIKQYQEQIQKKQNNQSQPPESEATQRDDVTLSQQQPQNPQPEQIQNVLVNNQNQRDGGNISKTQQKRGKKDKLSVNMDNQNQGQESQSEAKQNQQQGAQFQPWVPVQNYQDNQSLQILYQQFQQQQMQDLQHNNAKNNNTDLINIPNQNPQNNLFSQNELDNQDQTIKVLENLQGALPYLDQMSPQEQMNYIQSVSQQDNPRVQNIGNNDIQQLSNDQNMGLIINMLKAVNYDKEQINQLSNIKETLVNKPPQINQIGAKKDGLLNNNLNKPYINNNNNNSNNNNNNNVKNNKSPEFLAYRALIDQVYPEQRKLPLLLQDQSKEHNQQTEKQQPSFQQFQQVQQQPPHFQSQSQQYQQQSQQQQQQQFQSQQIQNIGKNQSRDLSNGQKQKSNSRKRKAQNLEDNQVQQQQPFGSQDQRNLEMLFLALNQPSNLLDQQQNIPQDQEAMDKLYQQSLQTTKKQREIQLLQQEQLHKQQDLDKQKQSNLNQNSLHQLMQQFLASQGQQMQG